MRQKVQLILYAFIIIVMFFTNSVYARKNEDEKEKTVFYQIIHGADSFLAFGDNKEVQESIGMDEKTLQSNLKDVSDSLYKVLLISAIVIAVIFSGVLGIKFMLGSIEEKAKVQEALVPFVIGCVVAFGAFGIWHIVVTIGNKL